MIVAKKSKITPYSYYRSLQAARCRVSWCRTLKQRRGCRGVAKGLSGSWDFCLVWQELADKLDWWCLCPGLQNGHPSLDRYWQWFRWCIELLALRLFLPRIECPRTGFENYRYLFVWLPLQYHSQVHLVKQKYRVIRHSIHFYWHKSQSKRQYHW